MSTLTGNKISLTYKSIIKTSDNDVLTGTLKQLSDGLGNNSGVYLNTGGDLKSTGTLEFANFKGTSTSVTINKLVNQADGISSNDNDTSLPTSAAVKDYVDTHVTSQDLDFSDGTTQSAIDLDSQVFSIVGTTNEIDTVASGQQLQIGLPNSITISGTYTGATFSGDLNGTINTATTAVTQAAGNNSTKVATTAYVDTLDAASDLDFSGTSGTGDVNLNTQTFAITGAANQITTAASNQGLVISLLSSGVTLPNNSVATTQSAGDNSTKVATTAYVDVLDAASDLDIAGDSGTGDVNLNTQTFTLSGTTNQVITSVSGQEATFSLPSTVHRNLQGNVTGDLTGNADTATAWETARDLILSSEATGTISNVDGTQNVTGAVTLLNSAVTGKVLTGLPTPAAGNIQSSDTILEAFGKLQSQVSSISNGLIFKGSWDAATNTPTLTSGGGEVDSGTTTGQTAFKLIETGQNFNTTVTIGDKVINQVDGTTALVTVIDSNTQLTLDADIMLSGEAYTIDASPFIPQGNYYVVNYAGTTNLNGITDWSIGDWVIADADNRWSKLDHSQVDGQGTPGHLPVFATATTIGDSIVAQSGTALTVTGSLTTTLGASVTGDFAVNTNKFTVAAASGTGTFAGNVTINGLVIGTDQTFAGEYRTFAFGTNANGYNRIFATKDQTDGIYLASATGHGLKVRVNGNSTNVLTIDSSGNSTFAGKILVGTGATAAASLNAYTQTVSANLYSALRIIENSGASSYWDIGATGGGSPDLNFYVNGGTTPKLTIDSSGNSTFAGDVTIGGKTYPKLNLTDNQGVARNFSVGTNNETFTVRNETGSADVFTIAGADNAATFAATVSATNVGVNGFITHNGDSGTFMGWSADDTNVFYTAGNERLRIDSSGNVGIGNANPSAFGKFIVEGTGNLLNLNATSGKVYQAFYENGVGRFYLNTLNGSDGLAFTDADGSTERMRIDSSGNVGIGGTAGDGYRLQVVGTSQDSTTISMTYVGVGAGALKMTSNGAMAFGVDNADGSTERMRIDSSGQVVIGNNPTPVSDSILTLRTSASTGLSIKSASNGGESFINFGDNDDINSGRIYYGHSDNAMRFRTNDALRMLIDSAGNVGIGTESPDQTGYGYKTLTIMGGTNAGDSGVIELLSPSVDAEGQNMGIVSFGAGGTRTGMISANRQGANNAANLRFWTSAGSGIIERMRITSTGTLTVGGQTNTRIVTTITENDKVDLNVTDGTNTARNLSFSTGGTQKMRLTSNGELKIGATVGAAAKLHIESTGLDRKTIIQGNANSQGISQKITLVNAYPVVSSGTKLIIPIANQGNLNSTTIIKIMGHSAKFNDPNPLGFTAEFAFGHLYTITNLSVLSSTGNISGIATNGLSNIEISFTSAYTGPTSNGVFATIEYMTNNISYSLQPTNIVMN